MYYFYLLNKLGTFTKVAQHLNISQSAISEQINQLEDTGKKCLIKGGEYTVNKIGNQYFEIESELFDIHEWDIDDLDEYFTIKRYTLQDLKDKKIAVRLRSYEEYKRLCEAIRDKYTDEEMQFK